MIFGRESKVVKLKDTQKHVKLIFPSSNKLLEEREQTLGKPSEEREKKQLKPGIEPGLQLGNPYDNSVEERRIF